MIDSFMKQLEKELEMEDPFPTKGQGIYEYYLEEDLPIAVVPLQPEGVVISASLGPAPKEEEEKFFAEMLSGNLFGRLTHGATLGLAADGKEMRLTRVAAYKFDYREFKLMLEDFIQVTNFWRGEAGLLAEEEEGEA